MPGPIIPKPQPVDIPNLASKLPRPLQKPAAMLGSIASEFLPAPDDVVGQLMPMPMMAHGPSDVAKALGGIKVEPYDQATWKMLEEVFRPKDLSKVLPPEMNISQVPPSLGVPKVVSHAFDDYRKTIKGLLGQ